MNPTLDFVVAIPARYAASRLPGKPLRLLGGEPLVLHVARRAPAAGAREVWVATDDGRVAAALEGSGVRIAMTSPDHASGTDRLAECAAIAGWREDRIVVNLQGDEPFAPAAGIRAVADALVASGAAMSTLALPIEDAHTLFDPNAVKLVRAAGGPHAGDALYFSRAPIPWHRDAFAHARDASAALPPGGPWLRHIGIYGYTAGFLRRFAALGPSPLEVVESLEQLRALDAGHRIAVALAPAPFPPGIDTPEDLARAEATLAALRAGGRAAVKLLMVCLGNICRSPLAEGALRARLAQARLEWVEVDSAGTGGWHAGEPPDRRSIAIAAEAGVDIRHQRARKLRDADFAAFDWLLCADRSVLRDVRAMRPAGPESAADAALLLEWAEQGAGAEIPDPYTGTREDFRRVWRMVDTAAERIVQRLASAPRRPAG